MATVINNPGERTVEERTVYSDSTAGWAVAVIVLIAIVLFGLFVWPGYLRTSAAPANTTTPNSTIQINVPGASGSGAVSPSTQSTPGASNPTGGTGATGGASSGGASRPTTGTTY